MCKTTADLVRFYHSIQVCNHNNPGDGAYWVCGCNKRTKLGFEIRKLVEVELEDAKTVSQAETIDVPKNIQTSCAEISAQLMQHKRYIIQKLKQQEENDRILSAIKKQS